MIAPAIVNPDRITYCRHCKKEVVFKGSGEVWPENLPAFMDQYERAHPNCPYCKKPLDYSLRERIKYRWLRRALSKEVNHREADC